MIKKQNEGGLVYSTEHGRVCPKCQQQVVLCRCGKGAVQVPRDGIVRLMRETKGRKGKGVTLVTGLPLAGKELQKMAKSLKQKCGCGGSVKNGTIEIQGDNRDRLEQELKGLGYKVKRAGG